MKTFLTSLAIWMCVFGSAKAQDLEKTTLIDVLHCIKNGDREWLASPLSDRQMLHAAGITDKSSYPGEKHLIVVVYESPQKGQVFDLKQETRHDKRLFTVENNGSFAVIKGKVVFKDPPLGGVWTQEHLARSVQKVMGIPQRSFSASRLITIPSGVVCASYASGEK